MALMMGISKIFFSPQNERENISLKRAGVSFFVKNTLC